jgi:hypothetical protein
MKIRPFALTATLLLLSAVVAVVVHSRNISSILLPKEATLQYEGPVYIGDGEWERTYSPQVPTAILARAQPNMAGRNQRPPNTKQSTSAFTSSKVVVGQHLATVRKVPVISKTLKAVRKLPSNVASPLSLDVGQLSDEISDGLTKIFHLHDNPVTMRSPVKILDHV